MGIKLKSFLILLGVSIFFMLLSLLPFLLAATENVIFILFLIVFVALLFPIAWVLSVKTYNHLVKKWNLYQINKVFIISVTGLITFMAIGWIPLIFAIEEGLGRITNYLLKADVEIVKEELVKVENKEGDPITFSEDDPNYNPYIKVDTFPYLYEYHYKISLDNKTPLTFNDLPINVMLGYSEKEDPDGFREFTPDFSHVKYDVKPGKNVIEGKVPVKFLVQVNLNDQTKGTVRIEFGKNYFAKKVYLDSTLSSDWTEIDKQQTDFYNLYTKKIMPQVTD